MQKLVIIWRMASLPANLQLTLLLVDAKLVYMNLAQANWIFGWSMILSGLLVGAGLGLFFHHENFLGGYASLRRRLLRLGHIALIALGALNVLYSYSARSGGSNRPL